ncbi:MAG TPA: FecR family protein [Bacteroidota bacterium]|nr:FecR family protein [Bacteroidota bacterium]
MRTLFILLLAAVVSSIGSAVAAPAFDPDKPVALIYKPVGTVEFLKEGKTWTKAAPATPLLSGDQVRTGANSFVVIKFIENSILRLQENSQITIHAELTANKEFSKDVNLDRGELTFDVKKRENEKFEFSTPTSVASIRGTQGMLITGSDSTDELILGAGIVLFTNNRSNQSVNVTPGQTAYSYANGKIEIKKTSPEELQKLQGALGSGGGGGTSANGTSSTGGFSVGFAIGAPVVTAGQDFSVTVELVQTSVPVDTLKSVVSYFALAYKSSGSSAYKELPASLTGSKVSFAVPGADVASPSMQIYVIFRTKTGVNLTYPPNDPQSNPIVIPVQSTGTNEIRLPFTDPNGNAKTMIIDY